MLKRYDPQAGCGKASPQPQCPAQAHGTLEDCWNQRPLRPSEGSEIMHALSADLSSSLPVDGCVGALAGRVWRPDICGPSVVAVRHEGVFDISRHFPTVCDLCETADPARALRTASGDPLGALEPILSNTRRMRGTDQNLGCSHRSIFKP